MVVLKSVLETPLSGPPVSLLLLSVFLLDFGIVSLFAWLLLITSHIYENCQEILYNAVYLQREYRYAYSEVGFQFLWELVYFQYTVTPGYRPSGSWLPKVFIKIPTLWQTLTSIFGYSTSMSLSKALSVFILSAELSESTIIFRKKVDPNIRFTSKDLKTFILSQSLTLQFTALLALHNVTCFLFIYLFFNI